MAQTALATTNTGIPSLSMSEQELMTVLENSLYPGATHESIKLVIGYCKAAGLDPMQKPVHIVPIWDSKAGRLRDVVMPGVGLYRTQAARSGQYAGVSEAEFGPDVTEKIGGVEITYPAWCKVTVKRLLPNGEAADFSATERWKENYAQKGGKDKSIAPNAMWTRRPYAQLAKCSEAQALRKAFPELGAAPTADEMEGKPMDDAIDGQYQREEPQQKTLPAYTQAQFEANFIDWKAAVAAGKTTAERLIAMVSSKYVLSDEQKAAIKTLKKQDEETEQPPADDWVGAYENAEEGAEA